MALVDVLSFDGVGIATAKPSGAKWGSAEIGAVKTIDTKVSVADIANKYKLNKGVLELLPEDYWRDNILKRRQALAELEGLVDYERKRRQLEDDPTSAALDKAVLNVLTGTQIPDDSAAELAQKLFLRTRTPEQMAEIEALFRQKLQEAR